MPGASQDFPRLISILTHIAGPDRTPPQVGPETPLTEGGLWLDSADLLEAVLACESEFSVRLDPPAIFADGSTLTVARLMDAVDGARHRRG
jgi:acyl carrier protein